MDADLPVLLGRERFFDHHRIKFDQDDNTFELICLKSPAGRTNSAATLLHNATGQGTVQNP